MVDSLPPSGIDPDDETISTNSNDKLEVIESTAYLANFAQDSGDWTGFDSVNEDFGGWTFIDDDDVEGGYAVVFPDVESDLPKSASVTADLTGIDVLNFRIVVHELYVKIKVDGIELVSIDDTDGFKTLEIRGLDDYDFGTNSTVTIEAYDDWNGSVGQFRIDYIRSNPIQPESRKIELVDTGGL